MLQTLTYLGAGAVALGSMWYFWLRLGKTETHSRAYWLLVFSLIMASGVAIADPRHGTQIAAKITSAAISWFEAGSAPKPNASQQTAGGTWRTTVTPPPAQVQAFAMDGFVIKTTFWVLAGIIFLSLLMKLVAAADDNMRGTEKESVQKIFVGLATIAFCAFVGESLRSTGSTAGVTLIEKSAASAISSLMLFVVLGAILLLNHYFSPLVLFMNVAFIATIGAGAGNFFQQYGNIFFEVLDMLGLKHQMVQWAIFLVATCYSVGDHFTRGEDIL